MNRKWKMWLLASALIVATSVACNRAKQQETANETAVPPAFNIEEVLSLTLEAAAEKYPELATLAVQKQQLPRTYQANGEVVMVPPHDWTSGFFVGSLLQLSNLGDFPVLKERALELQPLVASQQENKGTHDLGFMVYNSHKALLAENEKEIAPVLLNGAKSLASRYNDRALSIKSWDHKPKGHQDWQHPVIIDNMMNLELLFWASKYTGEPRYQEIAISHANTTLENHFRDDHSSFHVVDFDSSNGQPRWKGTHQGMADESAWARGQAWGLYGFTMSYRYTRNQAFLEKAEAIAGFIMNHPNLPADKVPYWDYNAKADAKTPRDASAAAIAASALAELHVHTGKPEYLQEAQAIAMSLVSDAYMNRDGSAGPFLLKHSTGHLPGNSEIDVPLVYADYYLLELVARLKELEMTSTLMF